MQAERHDIRTRDGHRLDGELARPESPSWGVVLTHPHPQYGGSMHNHAIEALFAAMPQHGAATFRFNFRGVGTSQGSFDHGDAERLDVLAAVETVSELLGRDAHGVVLAGYSFGADVALALDHLSIAGWWVVALCLLVALFFVGRSVARRLAERHGIDAESAKVQQGPDGTERRACHQCDPGGNPCAAGASSRICSPTRGSPRTSSSPSNSW